MYNHIAADRQATEKATASSSDTTVNSNITVNTPSSSPINKDHDGIENTISGKPTKLTILPNLMNLSQKKPLSG